jgi:amino acid transporter
MFSKINCWQIVKDHFLTLRDHKANKMSTGDAVLFIVAPLVISLSIFFGLQFRLDTNVSNALMTSLSVFSALLFNLLLLIYDIVRKEEKERKEEKDSKKDTLLLELLRQIYANISYSIFISVFTVAILLINFLDIKNICFVVIINCVVYYLTVQFVLTLFMILKRVHVLLKKEINKD